MKTVIRRGVFETNSSSTHSLSIFGTPKLEDEASFEICSPKAKMVTLLGLIDNAEPYVDPDDEPYEEQDEEPNEEPNKYDYTRALVYRFKEQAMKRYLEITSFTYEEAMAELEYEAFGYPEIREIWDDREALKKYRKRNYTFDREYEMSDIKDIVEFAHKYFYESFEENKRLMGARFRCDLYFSNGCLDVCTCAYDSFGGIAKGLGINIQDSDEQLYERAVAFLSDECKILANEYYCGFYLEKTGHKY